MPFSSPMNALTVNHCGAAAGSTLSGSGPHNQGLRIRVLQDQVSGQEGPVRGSFVILDAGKNQHSEALGALLDRVTTAKEVLEVLRRRRAGCGSVVHTDTLVVGQA